MNQIQNEAPPLTLDKESSEAESKSSGKNVKTQNIKPSEKEKKIPDHISNDLNKIINVKKLTSETLNILKAMTKDENLLLKNLQEIGMQLNDISWNENDKNRLRNKHGLRNRSDSNNLNKNGAKLDFETLSYLKELAIDNRRKSLLTQNYVDLETSLHALEKKSDFILLKEYRDLNNNQQSELEVWFSNLKLSDRQQDSQNDEIGFLQKVSAFYLDEKCLKRINGLLNEIQSPVLQSSKNIQERKYRYALGYFFVEIGETSKDISDFLKTGKDSSEINLKSLFQKIAKKRDDIKGNPKILQDYPYKVLLLMKKRLKLATPYLKRIIEALLHKLESLQMDEILKYDKFNIAEKNTGQSKFEEIHSKDIENAGRLLSSKKLETLMKEIEVLDKEIPSLEFEISSKCQRNLISEEILSSFKVSEKFLLEDGERFRAQLEHYLKYAEEYPKKSNSFEGYLNDAKESLGNPSKEDPKFGRLKSIEGLATLFKKSKKSKSGLECIDSHLDHLEEWKKCFEIKILEAEMCRKEEEKRKKRKEHEEETQKIKNLTEKISKIQAIPHIEQTESVCDPNGISAFQRILEKVLNEVNNLCSFKKDMEWEKLVNKDKEDFEKLPREAKMSFGILGQYYKEILNLAFKDDRSQVLPHENSLFFQDCFKTIQIRNKQLMHQLENCNPQIISDTIENHIVPWLNDLQCISFCLKKQSYEEEKVTRISFKEIGTFFENAPDVSRVPFDEYELRSKDRMIYYRYLKLAAWNRLLSNNQVVSEYKLLMEMVTEETDPALKTEIHYEAAQAYLNQEDIDEAINTFQKALLAAESIPFEMGNVQDYRHASKKLKFQTICIIRHHLAIALIQKEIPERFRDGQGKFEQALNHIENILSCPFADRSQRISTMRLKSEIEGLNGYPEVNKRSLEYLFVTEFEYLSEFDIFLGFKIVSALAYVEMDRYHLEEANDWISFAEELYHQNYPHFIDEVGQNTLFFGFFKNYSVYMLSILKSVLKTEKDCQADAQEVYRKLLEDGKKIEKFPVLMGMKALNDGTLTAAIILGKIVKASIPSSPLFKHEESLRAIEAEAQKMKALKACIILSKERSPIESRELILRLKAEIIGINEMLAKKYFLEEQYNKASEFIQKSILFEFIDEFLWRKFERNSERALNWAQSSEIDVEELKNFLRNRVSNSQNSAFPTLLKKYQQSIGNIEAYNQLVKECQIKLNFAIALEKKKEFYSAFRIEPEQEMMTFTMIKFEQNNPVREERETYSAGVQKIKTIGISYFKEKNFSSAMFYFDEALNFIIKNKVVLNRTEYADLFFWRGSSFLEMAKFLKAAANFLFVIKFDADHILAKLNLQICSLEIKRLKNYMIYDNSFE